MSNESHQFEWLLIALVYNHKHYDEIYKDIPGYITMEKQKNRLFHSIEDIQHNDKIKIVIVENRLSFEREADEVVGVSEIINIVEKTDTNKLTTIAKNDPSITESFTKPKSMEAILSKIKRSHKAKRHIVITLGHGSIFGINLITSPCSNQTKYNKKGLNEVEEKQDLMDHSFRKFYRIERDNNFLTNKSLELLQRNAPEKTSIEKIAKKVNASVFLSNKELASVIKKVWDSKLDILVMYNCLMQNLYTQYELRDCVDYFVAPESGICYPGYNYLGVLTELSKKTDATNEEVASFFLDTIRSDKKYKDFIRDIEGTWKISSMQLDEKLYDNIKARFSASIEEVLNLKKTSSNILICFNNTLNQCFNYAHICLNNNETEIDLLVFLKYLKQQIETGFPSCVTLLQEITPLIETLEGINYKSFIGKLYFPNDVSFIDKDYLNDNSAPGFGFVFQKKSFPRNTIQHSVLNNREVSYYPSFLRNTRFEELFEELSSFNESS